MRSNCAIRAWSHFVNGKASWMCLRRTKYSALARHTRRWYWKPLIPVGIAIQWFCMIGLVLGWMLRWGGWYHAAWVLPGGEWWEFIPVDDKTRRVIPPVIFTGVDQKIGKKHG